MQPKKAQEKNDVNPDCPMHGAKGKTNKKNLKLANNHRSKTEKVQPKPVEDVLGMQEYSFQNSVRFINRNPDMMNIPVVACACGKLIDRRTDWHVMIANGTLICWGCANCNSCLRGNTVLNKRLVCIDGLVLCHSCLTNFGYFVEPSIRMIIEETNNKAKPLDNPETTSNADKSEQPSTPPENPIKQPDISENPNNADPTDMLKQVACDARRLVDRLHSDSSSSNNATKPSASEKDISKVPDVLKEFQRPDRRMYVPKTDNRRPLRPVLYDQPSAHLPDNRNPLITAPVYDAYKGALEKMVCPVCHEPARGSAKYVVPSMARIYHRKCFACKSCQTPMCEGIQVAGVHFEFCSCEPPRVWCTKRVCRKQRMSHHEISVCWLGPQRPGGRMQIDTDLSAQIAKAAADKKAQSSTNATKTIEGSED